MAKFLDKKEQVIDFQLTPYGKHRLSVGQLKPAYYAFFDTGVTYDSEYAGFNEVQTKIHERIKTETQFLEGILLFEEAENTVPTSAYIGEETAAGVSFGSAGYVYSDDVAYGETGKTEFSVVVEDLRSDYGLSDDLSAKEVIDSIDYAIFHGGVSTSLFDLDIVPKKFVPKPNILSFESAIGDAVFEGENTQYAPAWKLLACQGEITNVESKDTSKYNFTSASYDNEVTEFNIPQIDIKANYTLEISSPSGILTEEVPSDFISETPQFLDGTTIKLIKNDVMIYAEEANTQLLTENFDVEVFEIIEDTGVTTKATATLNLCSSGASLAVGDTVTISDGITNVVFEIIDNTEADIDRAKGFSAGRIGVIASTNYQVNGVFFSRKGTIYNLISAIRQDSGGLSHGYPTPSRYGTDGSGDTKIHLGRCDSRLGAPVGCFIGRHNLKLDISEEIITSLRSHSFGSTGAYPVHITNLNTTLGNPNQEITTTAASSRIDPSGFSGGYVAKGTELKRKYFVDTIEQVVDGLMIAATKQEVKNPDITEDSVEYYFNILTDSDVSDKIACSCASAFNKNSYYIDIDFDCTKEDIERVYYDIYGSATDPEICNPASATSNAGAADPLSGLLPETDICEDE